MKYITLLALTLTIMASCSDEPITEPIDFAGTYEAQLDCTGELAEATESVTISIQRVDVDGNYIIDLGDDVLFHGTAVGSTLSIDRQILNEGGDFDVVTFEGEIVVDQDGEYTFDFQHEVDNEGMSTCQSVLIKQ
jgi:hypothetical protein